MIYHAWSLSGHGRLKILWSGSKNHIFGRPHGGVIMDFRFLLFLCLCGYKNKIICWVAKIGFEQLSCHFQIRLNHPQSDSYS